MIDGEIILEEVRSFVLDREKTAGAVWEEYKNALIKHKVFPIFILHF